MAVAGFFGYLLLGGGPALVIFCAFIARRSFLVLLAFASAFVWLTTLLFISALFRGFEPLQPKGGPYFALVLVSVLIEEVVRYVSWRLHGVMVDALDRIAHDISGARLSVSDLQLMALTHGVAHGGSHLFFFFVSWVDLAAGEGTFYVGACPQMNFFLYNALASMAFFLIHSFSMVVSFDGMAGQKKERALYGPVVHLVAALLTLISLAHSGCVFVIPLLLLLAVLSTAAAGWVVWEKVDLSPRLSAVSQVDEDTE